MVEIISIHVISSLGDFDFISGRLSSPSGRLFHGHFNASICVFFITLFEPYQIIYTNYSKFKGI